MTDPKAFTAPQANISTPTSSQQGKISGEIKRKLVEKLQEFSESTGNAKEFQDIKDDFLDWLQTHDTSFFNLLKSALGNIDKNDTFGNNEVFDRFWKDFMNHDHDLLAPYYTTYYQNKEKKQQGEMLRLHHSKVTQATSKNKLGTKESFETFIKSQKGKPDSENAKLLAYIESGKGFTPEMMDTYRDLRKAFEKKYIYDKDVNYQEGVHSAYIHKDLAKNIRSTNREIINHVAAGVYLSDTEKKNLTKQQAKIETSTGPLSLAVDLTIHDHIYDFSTEREDAEDGFGGKGAMLKGLKESLGRQDYRATDVYKVEKAKISKITNVSQKQEAEKTLWSGFLEFAKKRPTVTKNPETINSIISVLQDLDTDKVIDEKTIINALKPLLLERICGPKVKEHIYAQVRELEKGINQSANHTEKEKETMRQNARYYGLQKIKFQEELYDEKILKQSYIEEGTIPADTFSQSLTFAKKQRTFTPPAGGITSLSDLVESIDMQFSLDQKNVDPKRFAMLQDPKKHFSTYKNPETKDKNGNIQAGKSVSLLPYIDSDTSKTYICSGDEKNLPIGWKDLQNQEGKVENIAVLPGPHSFDELFSIIDKDTGEKIYTEKNPENTVLSNLTSTAGFLLPVDILEEYEDALLDGAFDGDDETTSKNKEKRIKILSENILSADIQTESNIVIEPSNGIYEHQFSLKNAGSTLYQIMEMKSLELKGKKAFLSPQENLNEEIDNLGINKKWLSGEKEAYTEDVNDTEYFDYIYQRKLYYREKDTGKTMQQTIQAEQQNIFARASQQLGITLSDIQKKLLRESHLYGNDNDYNGNNPEFLSIYHDDLREDSEENIGYSMPTLVEKRNILMTKGGYTKDEAMQLMRARIAGVPPSKKKGNKKKGGKNPDENGNESVIYDPELSLDEQIFDYEKEKNETITTAKKQAKKQIDDNYLQDIGDEFEAFETKKKRELSRVADEEKVRIEANKSNTTRTDLEKAQVSQGIKADLEVQQNAIEEIYTNEVEEFTKDPEKKAKYDQYKRIKEQEKNTIETATKSFQNTKQSLSQQEEDYNDPEKQKEKEESQEFIEKDLAEKTKKRFLNEFKDKVGDGTVDFRDGNVLLIKTSVESSLPGGGKQWLKVKIVDPDPDSDVYELELMEGSELYVDKGKRFQREKNSEDWRNFAGKWNKIVAVDTRVSGSIHEHSSYIGTKDNLQGRTLMVKEKDNGVEKSVPMQYIGTAGKTGKKVIKASGGIDGVTLENYDGDHKFKKTVDYDTFVAMMEDKKFMPLSAKDVEEAAKNGAIDNKKAEEDAALATPKPVGFFEGMVSLKGIVETIKGGFKGIGDRLKEADDLRTARYKRGLGQSLQKYGGGALGSFLYLDDIGLDLESSYDELLMSRIEKYSSMYSRKAGEGDSVHADNVVKKIEQQIFLKPEINAENPSHEFRLRAMGAFKYLCEKGGGPYIRKLANGKYSENGYRVLALLGKQHQAKFLKKRQELIAKMDGNNETAVDTLAKLELMYINKAMDGDENIKHQDIYPQKIIKNIEDRGNDNYSFTKTTGKAESTTGKSIEAMYDMFGAGIKTNNFSNTGALKSMVSEAENEEDYPIVFKAFLQLLVSGQMQAGSQFATKKYFDFFKGQARKAFVPLWGYFGKANSVESVARLLDMIAESKGFVKFSDYVKTKPGMSDRDPTKIGPDNFQKYTKPMFGAMNEWMDDNHKAVTDAFNQKEDYLLRHLSNTSNPEYKAAAEEFFTKVGVVRDDSGSIPEQRMNLFVGQGIMNANREQYSAMFNFNREGQFSGKDRVAKDMRNSYEDAIKTFNNLITTEQNLDAKKSYMKYFLERFQVAFGDKFGGDQKDILIQAAKSGNGVTISNLLESSVLQKKHTFPFTNKNGEYVEKEIPNSDNREEVYQNDAVTGVDALGDFFRQHASLMTGDRSEELLQKLVGDDTYRVVSS